MSKTIAILQSNYIPWKGYFDLIAAVDEFVILDSVQFTKNDWRNRNRIGTPRGPLWLTIPIRTSGRLSQRISEAEAADASWAKRHWQTIAQHYARAPRFQQYGEELREVYAQAACEPRLSHINKMFLDLICRWLGIDTLITSSEKYPDHPYRVDRLIGICQAAQACRYLTGPKAQAYLDPDRFAAAGIGVEFFAYRDYGAQPLSAIDSVLN